MTSFIKDELDLKLIQADIDNCGVYQKTILGHYNSASENVDPRTYTEIDKPFLDSLEKEHKDILLQIEKSTELSIKTQKDLSIKTLDFEIEKMKHLSDLYKKSLNLIVELRKELNKYIDESDKMKIDELEYINLINEHQDRIIKLQSEDIERGKSAVENFYRYKPPELKFIKRADF